MVYYFTSHCDGVDFLLYMGKDKFENELLIAHGWPEDVWFHADNLSSAHVYVRLPEGVDFESIPAQVLNDCAQLTKENSIKGKKQKSIKVVYTPWSNLHKTGAMEVGQVGFHKEKLRKYIVQVERDLAVLGRLKKTMQERTDVDFQLERLEHDKEENAKKRAFQREKDQEERQLQAERARQRELHSYDRVFIEADMQYNTDMKMGVDDYEDSF
ncbi:hypothetical protein PBRA_004554, partial [Plasmodiophora brassicae]